MAFQNIFASLLTGFIGTKVQKIVLL